MTNLVSADTETRLSRKELYELVWSTPMSKLAKRFNLSDVGLAKICKRYNIPRPGVGHWTKRAHGKPLTKESLPKATDPSLDTVVIIHGLEPTRNEVAQEFFVDQLKTLAASEHEPANIIRVGDALHSPHRIVQQTGQAIQNVRIDSCGIVCLRTESLLWLQVAKPSIGRALRILDAVVKALELRGFQIKSPSLRHKRSACIVWRNREIEFRIRERLKRQDHVANEKERRDQARFSYMAPPMWELIPTGQLELEIQGMVVRDSLKLHVENQINKLLLRLYRHLDNSERQQAEWKQGGGAKSSEADPNCAGSTTTAAS